jgi:hypothetical protein
MAQGLYPPESTELVSGIGRELWANPRSPLYGAKGDLVSMDGLVLSADQPTVVGPPGTFSVADHDKVIWCSATADTLPPRSASDVSMSKGLSFVATSSVPSGLPNVPRWVMTHLDDPAIRALVSPAYYGNVISSPSMMAFTPQDRWRFISIIGAAALGGNIDTQILAVVDAQTAITVDCATTTVAGATATIWGTRTITDGATGANVAAIASTSANWTLYDIGAWVRIPDAGAGGSTFTAQITGIDFFNSRALLSAAPPLAVTYAVCLISTWSPLVSTILSTSADGSTATMRHSAFCPLSSATVWWGTDDTLAIQRAVDSGLNVFLPDGDYLVNTLAVDNVYGRTGYYCQIARNNFVMEGYGARLVTGGGNPRDVSGVEVGDSWSAYHDIRIEGIQFEGNHGDGTNNCVLALGGTGHIIPSQTGGAPIISQSDFNGAVNVRGQYIPWGVVPNVQTKLGAGRPYQAATERVTLESCSFSGWSKSGVTGLSYADYIEVLHCLFDGENRWSNNIHVDGTRGMRIEGCLMRNGVSVAQNPSFVSLLVNGDMGFRPYWDGVIVNNVFDNLQNGNCIAIGALHAKILNNVFRQIGGAAIGTSNYASQFPPPTANGVEFGPRGLLVQGNTFEDGANGILLLGWNGGASAMSATPVVSGGQVTGVTVPAGLAGTRVPPMLFVVGDGQAAQIAPTMATGQVARVLLSSGGGGYYAPAGIPAATCVFDPPGIGRTATGTASLSGGSVSGVTITDGGSNYPTVPAVTFSPPPSGTTATGVAVLTGSVVTGVTITNPGSGYGTTPPSMTFSAPGQATGTVSVVNGIVTAVLVSYRGQGYTTPPNVTITPYATSGVVPAVVQRVSLLGQIFQPTITKPGGGYVTPIATVVGGGGSGAQITLTVGLGTIPDIILTAGGAAYSQANPPVVRFLGTGVPLVPAHEATVPVQIDPGTGAITGFGTLQGGQDYTITPTVVFDTSQGQPGSGATATATMVGGVITGVSLTAQGTGYSAANPPVVRFVGAGVPTDPTTFATVKVVLDLATGAVIGFCNLVYGSGYSVVPTLVFDTSAGQPGSGAAATPVLQPPGALVGYSIADYGQGYTADPLIHISDSTPGAPTQQGAMNCVIEGSAMVGASVINPGHDYNTTQVSIIDTAAKGGSGYTLVATVAGGQVTGITVVGATGGGTGFTSAPTIALNNFGCLTGAGQRGATGFTATMVDDGTGHGTFKIASVTGPTDGGAGYTTGVVPLVSAGGYGATANAITLGGAVTNCNLSAPGYGYQLSTTSVVASGGGGSGMVVTPSPYSLSGWPATGNPVDKSNPGLTGLTLVNGGQGYPTLPAIVFLSGGYHLGSGATGTAVVGPSGNVTAISLTSGQGYTSTPSVRFAGGGGAGAAAHVGAPVNGAIVSITLDNGGTTPYTSAPDVIIDGGGGAGARAICTINTATGKVNAVYLVSGGDYLYAPLVQLLDPAGSGATAIALLANQIATPPTGDLPCGVIGYRVLKGGSGYSSATPPTVVVMPFPGTNTMSSLIQYNQFITNPYTRKTSLRANFAVNPPVYYAPDDVGPGLPSISTYWYAASLALQYTGQTWCSKNIFRGNYLEGYYPPGGTGTNAIIQDNSSGQNFYLDNMFGDPIVGTQAIQLNPLSVEQGSVYLDQESIGDIFTNYGYEVGRAGTPLKVTGASAVTTWPGLPITIPNGGRVTTTVGVPGVKVGDTAAVTVIGPLPPPGCRLDAQPTAGHSVTVTLTNASGSSQTINSLTFRVAGQAW